MSGDGGGTDNTITGGIFFSAAIQGRDITVVLPPEITPAMTGLPPATPTFTGRGTELAALLETLTPAEGSSGPEAGTAIPPTTLIAAVVGGMGGIGKTELALQAAHTALAQGWFPGGVLFVDMFGYDPDRSLTPDRATAGFLRALKIPSEHIPADPQDLERLLRSVLAAYANAGRRVLLVIDNVSTSQQARPLLPSDGSCAAIVTSRHILADLDARLLNLGTLPTSQAVELLDKALRRRDPSDARVSDHYGDAERLAELCAGLPLALQIVAALLAAHQGKPVAEMAQELAAEETRLAELEYGDRAVRAAFALSYHRLDPEHARVFRLLSLNPGPDFSTEAAGVLAGAYKLGGLVTGLQLSEGNRALQWLTAMTGAHQPATRRVLEALARAHLIEQSTGYGRWGMHDLVRLFAHEQGRVAAKADSRAGVSGVLLFYYLAGARSATAHLEQTIDDAPTWGFSTEEQALKWLDTEYDNLVAAAHAASGNRSVEVVAMELPLTLEHIMTLRRRFNDALSLIPIAVKAARRLRSPDREAVALRNRGGVLAQVRRFDEALDDLHASITLYRKVGDRRGEATAMSTLGAVFVEIRRFDEAISTLETARQIHRDTGAQYSEGVALANLANALAATGRWEEAASAAEAAASIHRQVGDQRARANALAAQGQALERTGRLQEAAAISRSAARLHHMIGNQHGEAGALAILGGTLAEMERYDEAIHTLLNAIEVFRETSDRHGEAAALVNFGNAVEGAGRGDEAVTAYLDAIPLFRDTDDRAGEALTYANLGIAYKRLGRADECIAAHTQASALYREIEHLRGAGTSLKHLAVALWEKQQPEKAMAAAEDALQIYRELGDRSEEAKLLIMHGLALRRAKMLDEAIAAHRNSVQAFRDVSDRQGERIALDALGQSLYEAERYEEAVTAYRKIIAIGHDGNTDGDDGMTLRRLAIALTSIERFEEAVACYEELLATAAFSDDRAKGWTLVNLAMLRANLGRVEDAATAAREAVAIFEQAGDDEARTHARKILEDLEHTQTR